MRGCGVPNDPFWTRSLSRLSACISYNSFLPFFLFHSPLLSPPPPTLVIPVPDEWSTSLFPRCHARSSHGKYHSRPIPSSPIIQSDHLMLSRYAYILTFMCFPCRFDHNAFCAPPAPRFSHHDMSDMLNQPLLLRYCKVCHFLW